MKLKIVTKKASNGNVRLLLSYYCQTRQLFATGVIIPSQDFREGHLEKPVAKTTRCRTGKKFDERFQTFLNEKNFTAATLQLYMLMYKRRTERHPDLDIETYDANSWQRIKNNENAIG